MPNWPQRKSDSIAPNISSPDELVMPALRIHIFQQVPFEDAAYLAVWAKNQQHVLSYTRFYEEPVLPSINAFDWLVILGGPMGVYEEHLYPWLGTQKTFIREAIAAQKTVIGICLGAQLIASALGANVYAQPHQEIGWFPIHKTSEGGQCPLLDQVPQHFKAFHWHGDTFDLPPGAQHLFESEACLNQGFLYQQRVLGLQFHLEVTPASLQTMIKQAGAELQAKNYVQTPQEISTQQHLCSVQNTYLHGILSKLATG